MPYPLIVKLEKLVQLFPKELIEADVDLTNDAPLTLNDRLFELLEEVIDLARNEFGPNVPSPREANIMEARGFPVRFVKSAQVTGGVPSIFTSVGRISYR